MTPLQQLDVVSSPEHRSPLPTQSVGISRQAFKFTDPFRQLDPHATSGQRTIRIALAGCGVVGSELARLLHDSAPTIASRCGVRFVITSVLVRDTTRDRN